MKANNPFLKSIYLQVFGIIMLLGISNAQTIQFEDLTNVQNVTGLEITNFAEPFQGKRWALGPTSGIAFTLAQATELSLSIAFFVPQANQRVIVELNGATAAVFDELEQYRFSLNEISLNAVQGRNEIRLIYDDWNSNKETFAPNDPRLMAVELSEFKLQDMTSFRASQGQVNELCKERLVEYERIFTAQDIFFYPDEMLNPWLGIERTDYTKAVDLMKAFQQALARQGTELILLPVPPRNLLWEDKFAGLDYSNYNVILDTQRGNHEELMTLLNQANILTINIDDYLGNAADGLLYKQDIHWTPEGARVVANGFSELLTNNSAYTALEKTAYRNAITGSRDRYPSAQPVIGILENLCNLNLPPEPLNLYAVAKDTGFSVDVQGLDSLETVDPMRRWALGPQTSFDFNVAQAQTFTLELSLFNPIADQAITINLNGQPLQTLNLDTPFILYNEQLELNLSAGSHTLTFDYKAWNKGDTQFAPNDSRPLAAEFQIITLQSDSTSYNVMDPSLNDTEEVSALSLFGDAASPPVVLVGSSFSQDVLNFSGFLQESLSLEVLNMSVPGGGTFSGIKDYLLDNAYLETPPSFLIWEFPAYGTVDTWQGDFNHLIGSAYGTCSTPTTSHTLTLEQGQADLKEPINLNPTQQHYAYININDPLVSELELTLNYADTTTQTNKIRHSNRMTRKGEFFIMLENPNNIQSLRILTDAQGQATLELCSLSN